MRDGATFKVEGLNALEQAFDELNKAAAKNTAKRTLRNALKPVAQTAIKFAPDDPLTGAPDLHRSIKVSDKLSKRLLRTASSKFYVDMYMGPTKEGYPQAIIQEFGSIHHAPNAYMRPAWEQHKGSLVGRIRDELKVEIAKSVDRARRKALKHAK